MIAKLFPKIIRANEVLRGIATALDSKKSLSDSQKEKGLALISSYARVLGSKTVLSE